MTQTSGILNRRDKVWLLGVRSPPCPFERSNGKAHPRLWPNLPTDYAPVNAATGVGCSALLDR